MGGRMPERMLALGVVKGEQLDLAVGSDRRAQVTDRAVYFCAANCLVQSRAD